MIDILLCSVSLANIFYAFKGSQIISDNGINLDLMFTLSFLTLWNLYLISLFCISQIVYRTIKIFKKTKGRFLRNLKAINNILFPTNLTFSILITIAYWTMKLFDNNFFVPKTFMGHKVHINLITDLRLHFFPALLLIFMWRNYNFHQLNEARLTIRITGILYCIAININYLKYGLWPYNFMKLMKSSSKPRQWH